MRKEDKKDVPKHTVICGVGGSGRAGRAYHFAVDNGTVKNCEETTSGLKNITRLVKSKSITLRLTLKKKWFDMIARGEKTEEYREIKPYWIKRLRFDIWNVRPFQYVEFRNGYKKDSVQESR